MISAHDTTDGRALYLPRVRADGEMEFVRARVNRGELVCRDCQALLWLKAGERRRPHFAHRVRSDCPQSNVSEAVQDARWQLFEFFERRIASGKLTGPVELEPCVPGLPKGTRVDLIVRRGDKPAVAVMFLERGLKPNAREEITACLDECGFLFRPVFLISRLESSEVEGITIYRLDTTQREWRGCTPYGVSAGLWGSSEPCSRFRQRGRMSSPPALWICGPVLPGWQ